jgi:hypothetical protein
MLLLLGSLADTIRALHMGTVMNMMALQRQAQTCVVSHLLVQLAMQQQGRAQQVQQLPSSHGNTFGIAAAMHLLSQDGGRPKLQASGEHK